jgi:predicted site-specific integrase-resolvase
MLELFCSSHGWTFEILSDQGTEPSFEEELASGVLEIITVFSARLYGSRSRKNKKLLEKLGAAVRDADSKGH